MTNAEKTAVGAALGHLVIAESYMREVRAHVARSHDPAFELAVTRLAEEHERARNILVVAQGPVQS